MRDFGAFTGDRNEETNEDDEGSPDEKDMCMNWYGMNNQSMLAHFQ